MRRNNLLTFIASLALVTSFIMPANAAKHKELPALGDTQIQIFDKTNICFRPDSFANYTGKCRWRYPFGEWAYYS